MQSGVGILSFQTRDQTRHGHPLSRTLIGFRGGKETPAVEPVSLHKSGVYRSGKWRYRLDVGSAAMTFSRQAILAYNGKRLKPTYWNFGIVTPWGLMIRGLPVPGDLADLWLPPEAFPMKDLPARTRWLEKEMRRTVLSREFGGGTKVNTWPGLREKLTPLIPGVLQSRHPEVRRIAITWLWKLKCPDRVGLTVRLLERLLDKPADADGHARFAACENLGKSRDRAAVPVLLRALEDPWFCEIYISSGKYICVWRAADGALRKITDASPIDRVVMPGPPPDPKDRLRTSAAWTRWWKRRITSASAATRPGKTVVDGAAR